MTRAEQPWDPFWEYVLGEQLKEEELEYEDEGSLVDGELEIRLPKTKRLDGLVSLSRSRSKSRSIAKSATEARNATNEGRGRSRSSIASSRDGSESRRSFGAWLSDGKRGHIPERSSKSPNPIRRQWRKSKSASGKLENEKEEEEQTLGLGSFSSAFERTQKSEIVEDGTDGDKKRRAFLQRGFSLRSRRSESQRSGVLSASSVASSEPVSIFSGGTSIFSGDTSDEEPVQPSLWEKFDELFFFDSPSPSADPHTLSPASSGTSFDFESKADPLYSSLHEPASTESKRKSVNKAARARSFPTKYYEKNGTISSILVRNKTAPTSSKEARAVLKAEKKTIPLARSSALLRKKSSKSTDKKSQKPLSTSNQDQGVFTIGNLFWTSDPDEGSAVSSIDECTDDAESTIASSVVSEDVSLITDDDTSLGSSVGNISTIESAGARGNLVEVKLAYSQEPLIVGQRTESGLGSLPIIDENDTFDDTLNKEVALDDDEQTIDRFDARRQINQNDSKDLDQAVQSARESGIVEEALIRGPPKRHRSLPEHVTGTRTGFMGCRSIRDATGMSPAIWSKQTGISVSELSPEEMSEIFPKLRTVSDGDDAFSPHAHELGNSKSFENTYPAHLQASLHTEGPQSLFEYEYENIVDLKIMYDRFGSSPRTTMSLLATDSPPERFTEGESSFNEVVIQVEASTVSQTDCIIRKGHWWGADSVPLPNVPGVDFVGKVFRIDKQSSKQFKLRKGDRVMALTKWGGNSRYISMDPSQLVRAPSDGDPAEIACIIETYLTAFQLLHHGQKGGIRYRPQSLKGMNILVLGSLTTNLGRALVQVSKCGNALQVYSTSKPKHFDTLSMMGVIPLRRDPLEWADKLKDKIDLIVSFEEPVTPLHYKLLSKNGDVLVLNRSVAGSLSVNDDFTMQLASRMVCSRAKTLRTNQTYSYDVFQEWETRFEVCKRDLEHLIMLLNKKTLSPSVLDRIPLSKVARAQELIESKRLSGFIVCEPWMKTKTRAIRL